MAHVVETLPHERQGPNNLSCIVNLLRPSDAYMCQLTKLVGAKPLSEPMLEYCTLEPYRNKFQWNPKRNSYIFIPENVFENVVCEVVTI